MEYTWDATKSSVTFENYPKGDYEMTVGDPKAFLYERKDGKPDSRGVRYAMRIVGGEYDGKPASFSAFFGDDGANSWLKQLLMSANGFEIDKKGEREFEAWAASQNLNIDFDALTLGEGWHTPVGKNVIASLDLVVNKNDPEKVYQNFSAFRPISG